MSDLQSRIQQLTKLILTSQTVDESKGDESRPASPTKLDFDQSPYQVCQHFASPSLIFFSYKSLLASARAPLRQKANRDSSHSNFIARSGASCSTGIACRCARK